MGEWHKVDEKVTQTSWWHSRYNKAERGGKKGYIDEKYGIFHEYPEKEQPKQKPFGFDFRMTEPTGPSVWDEAIGKMEGAVGDALKDSMKSLITIAGFIFGFALIKKFSSELKKDPQDVVGAMGRTARYALCSVGGLGVLLVTWVLMSVLSACADTYGNTWAGIVFQILRAFSVACGLYVMFGLSRVAEGKTFWIRLDMSKISSIRRMKIPRIAYVGIEVLSVVLLTMPILNFIDSFTVEWADANRNILSDDQLITIGICMFGGSAAAAAVVGLVICLLLRLVARGR